MSELLKYIANKIVALRHPNTPFIAGISGIDTSGKSELTKGLGDFLNEEGYHVQIIHLDDFHHPRAIRNGGVDEVENYYKRTFDLNLLRRSILYPIQNNCGVKTTLTLLDLDTDTYSRKISYRVFPHSIVLIEGIFLFRPELARVFDYKIWLDITEATAWKRIETRDVPRFGADILSRYERKYFPAQRIYIQKYQPKLKANLTINNNDWTEPIIVTYQS
jgi:uridine kinase